MLTLKGIGERAYKNCVRVGFRGKGVSEPSPLEIHALIHSEIAEATEEIRNKKWAFYLKGHDGEGNDTPDFETIEWQLSKHPGAKPEGEAVEFADAIIRILETAYTKGWDMDAILEAKMSYNETRPYKHGGKKL